MRHQVAGRKFSRNTKERKALFLSAFHTLIKRGSMRTTLAKGKTFKSLMEKLITTAKKGDLASRRRIQSVVKDRELTNKLVEEIAPVFKGRPGGYLRLIRLFPRRGDNAQMVKLEFVEYPKKTEQEIKKKKEEKPSDADKVKTN